MTITDLALRQPNAITQQDHTLREPIQVSYTYWPVTFLNGDPTVISESPLPLSGVQFSMGLRMAGELKASLQLADPSVRAINPWALIINRKTGIVVVRGVLDPTTGTWTYTALGMYIVWSSPSDPATGRMTITANSVESLWGRRYITGTIGGQPVTWSQADQQQIAADLLNPPKWSQIATASGMYPGWITVDPPTVPTGVLRDMSYDLGSQTNLLTAHQDRSNVINGYEWYTTLRVLSGTDALSAASYRCQFILGYPRTGAQFAKGQQVPQFRSRVDGSGNVTSYTYANDGSNVANIVWGNGAGYQSSAVQALSTNSSDWGFGFLQTEGQYSNPDVSVQSTLQQYTNAQIVTGLNNERYVSGLTVRGDLPPYFGTYGMGDDLLLEVDDWIWPDQTDGTRAVEFLTRITAWTVTPPEGQNAEKVSLTVSGGDL